MDPPAETPSTRLPIAARLVAFSADHAGVVAAVGFALAVAAMIFTVTHFSLNSDTDQLISWKLPWRQREATFNRLFHIEGDQIVAVIDGATPELAEEAAAALTARLQSRPDLFRFVDRPDGGPYFAREGLLFQDVAQVRDQMDQLVKAQPFLGPLAADPSLRGLAGTLSTVVQGVSAGQVALTDLNRPITGLAGTLDTLRSGRPAFFSWRALISDKPVDRRELRRIVVASPILDFKNLLSGQKPTAFIRHAARAAHFDPAHGVRVRLTGPVPLQDEEFATLADRAGLIGSLAGAAILIMLWMAVRSPRLIAAIVTTTLIGLVCAAAVGLLIFHRFNVISVAFIPLFVGLGIDFGIQMSVRFRAELEAWLTLRDALVAAGRGMGRSLTLAATAIATGFLAFAPTAYVGVSQLGVIAGLGMFIALGLNLTVLPALIRLLGAPSGAPPHEAAFLERLDGVILGHRRLVVGTAVAAALVCAASLPWVRFDFDTLHMKSAKVESVATLLDLMSDPDQSPNTVEIIAPSLAAADALARRLERLPEVSQARTLSSFIPTDQAEKLAIIRDAATLLDLTLDPLVTEPPPSDAENVAALRKTAADLRAAAANSTRISAQAALRLAGDFDWLADAPPAARVLATQMLMPPLETVLAQTRTALSAQPVTLADLPPEITRDWLAPDGRARASVVPRGDANNTAVLDRFIDAVQRVVPDATGPAVEVREGGRAVAAAFAEAGALSFVAITLLLYGVLRRVRDVAITMAPIVLTGLLTLGTCVAIGQPLNFANIIALPLLFGIGVAFHIYFVMAWRGGGTHLLQSSLTRAVFFSALATATGFGSLWASRHPGTASMGKLLMISLVWTLVSALLFQPALMGPPPKDRARAET
ncbi:MAG: hopanoid biosynthesis associated transporter-like protein HpnN [Caulobacteraceae bacterium]|nr:hopanoid biosynthesis associated transporter-like protein HpnN [Caulobacteraceae bacterium]